MLSVLFDFEIIYLLLAPYMKIFIQKIGKLLDKYNVINYITLYEGIDAVKRVRRDAEQYDKMRGICIRGKMYGCTELPGDFVGN